MTSSPLAFESPHYFPGLMTSLWGRDFCNLCIWLSANTVVIFVIFITFIIPGSLWSPGRKTFLLIQPPQWVFSIFPLLYQTSFDLFSWLHPGWGFQETFLESLFLSPHLSVSNAMGQYHWGVLPLSDLVLHSLPLPICAYTLWYQGWTAEQLIILHQLCGRSKSLIRFF